MIHLFQGDPIRGRIVINLLRHAGAIIRQVLVPQRDEEGGQTPALIRRHRFHFSADLLNTHFIKVGRRGGIGNGGDSTGQRSPLARVDNLRTCADTFSPPKPPRRAAHLRAAGDEIRGMDAMARENATAPHS